MIIGASNGVIAADIKSSEARATDTYKVDSTCEVSVTGDDTSESFGDTFTAALESNVDDSKKKLSFSFKENSPELGTVSILNASDGNPFADQNNVSAASEVKFKMKAEKVEDGTLIKAGTYEAVVLVTASCDPYSN